MKIRLIKILIICTFTQLLYAQKIIESISDFPVIVSNATKSGISYSFWYNQEAFYIQASDLNNRIIYKHALSFNISMYNAYSNLTAVRIYIDDSGACYITGCIPGYVLLDFNRIDNTTKNQKKGIVPLSDGTYDYFGVLKFDAKGNLVTKIKLNGFNIQTRAVCTDPDGNIYFGGTHFYTAIKADGLTSLAAPYAFEQGPIFIAKSNKQGKVIYLTSFPGQNYSGLWKMSYDLIKKQILAAGSYSGQIIFGKDTLESYGFGNGQFFLASFDANSLKYKWNKHGLAAYSQLQDFTFDSETIYAPVIVENSPFLFESRQLKTTKNLHTFMMKFSKDGLTKEIKSYDSSASIQVRRIFFDQDNNLILGGMFDSKTLQLGGFTIQNQSRLKKYPLDSFDWDTDGFFVKMTKSGDVLSAYGIGGTDQDGVLLDLYADTKKNVYHLIPSLQPRSLQDPNYSYVFGNNNNLIFPSGMGSTHIVFEDEFTVPSHDLSNQLNIKIFPNPITANQLNIQCSKYFNGKVEVINSIGKLVGSFKISGSQIKIDISNIFNGVYLIKLESNHEAVSKKIIVQR